MTFRAVQCILLAALVAACGGAPEPTGAGPDAANDASSDGADHVDAPANRPPTADAGRDLASAVGLATRLDGRASADPDGDALRFRWTIAEAPSGAKGELRDDDTARPTLVPDRAGTWTLALTVSDGRVESAPDRATSEVRESNGCVPVFVGSGELDDLARGERVELPFERRIHVVLLAEGYLASELGIFEKDTQAWLDDVFAVEPYASFRDALVVWALPVASAEHVTVSSPQKSDTAFRVPVAGAAIDTIPTQGPTAEAVWDAIDRLPFPPTRFYEGNGQLVFTAKDVVVHLLVFDPALGAQGFSGVATNLRRASDGKHWVAAAASRKLSHELGHAFGRLRDEYLHERYPGVENGLATKSSHLVNVVEEPACSTLPWAHLLDGSSLNPETRGLVGAFGTPKSGYHSELRCLRNGWTGNATYFGGDGALRSPQLCNWCREIVAFRFFERVGILDDEETSWAEWVAKYRAPFYAKMPVRVPDPVPQENSEGTPIHHACAP